MTDARIGGLVDERYRVLEAMASGSMGVVYKGERVPVGKLVAIKFLHAPFANDSEFLARFERETRVMSKLTHPNCVSVVDFGVWEGDPYLVMEYVSGTTLRALIDNGALPPKRALALVRQIAAGLAHAHAQGVVHRDVKPANIMISEEIGTGDHARILDFGLARLRGAVGRDATQSNVVVGTPNYMAPEQTVGGGLIDARTDIYAVGVVLFEMICGDRPFQAEDTLALLGMHRAAPIPKLADRVPSGVTLPPGLQEVVEKAMAKAPGDRFQSAIELAEAIDEVATPPAGGDSGRRVIRRSTEARKAVGHAPTMLDISDEAELIEPPPRPPPLPSRPRPRSSFLGSLMFLAILLGGIGGAVWWVKLRSTGSKRPPTKPAMPPTTMAEATPKPDTRPYTRVDTAGALGTGAQAGSSGSAAGPQAPAPGSGTGVAAGSGSSAAGESAAVLVAAATGPGSDAGSAAGAGAAEPAIAAGSTEPVSGDAKQAEAATEPSGAGSASDIEMDPAIAVDPAPPSTKPSSNEDEAANAPKSVEEVEKRAPATPVRATTLSGAVQLITEGKRELALASLRALWKKAPTSAYIPFLLGNLYYDQRWWSVAMDHYGTAIKKNAKYRANPTLNRNVIRMLASNQTARRAQTFLKYSVGRAALPYVRYAAQHDTNSQVKRLSGWLAKNI